MTDIYKLFQPSKVETFKKAVAAATEIQKAKKVRDILTAVLADEKKVGYYLQYLYSVDFNIANIYKEMNSDDEFQISGYEQLVSVYYFSENKVESFKKDLKPEFYTMTELQVEVDNIDSNVCLIREDFFMYREPFKVYTEVVKYIPYVSHLAIFSHEKQSYFLADSTIIDILSGTQTDNPHFIKPEENDTGKKQAA